MREAFETFQLPVVNGHGDLKPSNVMLMDGSSGATDEKGFNVVTRSDCCATTSPEGQGVTGGSFGMFSTPMTCADFEKTLVSQ